MQPTRRDALHRNFERLIARGARPGPGRRRQRLPLQATGFLQTGPRHTECAFQSAGLVEPHTGRSRRTAAVSGWNPQFNPETAAAPWFGFNANAATHAIHSFVDDGQPHSSSLVDAVPMNAVEHPEQMLDFGGFDADSIIREPKADEP